MSFWDEPKLSITEARTIINDEEVKDGDIIVLTKNGEEVERGVIKFCVYSDGEGFYDYYHIGFIVKWNDLDQYFPRTLADAISAARDAGIEWKIIKEDWK